MKKGFTLIELLLVIALIALLSVMIVANFSTNLSVSSEKEMATFKKTINDAACTYIELSSNKMLKDRCKESGCNIRVEDLLKAGLITEDSLNRPDGNKLANTTSISITYTGGEKKCELNI